MKSSYRISVYKTSGELLTLDSFCSRLQVERAYRALCLMLNKQPYARLALSLVTPFGLELIYKSEIRHV